MKGTVLVISAFVLGGLGGFLLASRGPIASFARPAAVSNAAVPNDAVLNADSSDEESEGVAAVESVSFVIDDGVTEVVETSNDETSVSDDDQSVAEVFTAEELAQMQQRRAAMREKLIKARNRKLEFIDSIDTSYLTESQKVIHKAYAETLARRNDAKERFRESDKTGTDYLEALVEIKCCEDDLLLQADAERKILMEAAARSVGLEGEAIGDFLDILKSIESCTSGLKD